MAITSNTRKRTRSSADVGELKTLPPATRPILVTGVAGFIGSFTAEYLLKRGDIVVGIDEVNSYYSIETKEANIELLTKLGGDNFRFYKGDLCDRELLNKVFDKEDPCRIIHLAARAGVRPSIDDPMLYVHSNVEATTLLLEMARKHECEHFVFASSSSVYGSREDGMFSETDNVDHPVSPYAATKKATELMAYTYYHLYKMPCTGLRFFTVYGPRGRPDMAPYMFVDKVYRGDVLKQFGDGTSARDYTFIDDIVDGVIRALDRPNGYEIYNLGNGNPVTLKHFISTVEDLLGKKAVIKVLPDQPGDVPRTAANINKAMKNLGYYPKYKFEDGLKISVDFYHSQIANKKQKAISEVKKVSGISVEVDGIAVNTGYSSTVSSPVTLNTDSE